MNQIRKKIFKTGFLRGSRLGSIKLGTVKNFFVMDRSGMRSILSVRSGRGWSPPGPAQRHPEHLQVQFWHKISFSSVTFAQIELSLRSFDEIVRLDEL